MEKNNNNNSFIYYAREHSLLLPGGVQAGLLLLKPINVPEGKPFYGNRKTTFTSGDSQVSGLRVQRNVRY
ncbi:hypothetical protein Phum_PHUM536410 [Pediculus humanus corporis]|uniref:Uncharacterized protein n=1 Tax=Pediculus humanus subsp. corporis TaxID=121224 RepID=E0VZM2_PEDHC|nr:uncharacterized protein Phum_PHUM536410 [Pediculus humanus corporis]EEB18828.1 hypothetical protein Phum_PHUM536410 [Pediculus humanus corporis]